MGAALGGLALLCAASPASAISLQEALQHLLDNHPQIKASKDNVSSASAAVKSSEAAFLPSVALASDYGYKEIDNPSLRAAGDEFGRPFDRHTLTVTQNLWDGQLKNFSKQGAEIGEDVAKTNLRSTTQNLQQEASLAYIDVIRQAGLVEIAREDEATIALQLNLEDERVQKGGGTAVDVLFAKTRLQLSKERRIVFEGALRDAITRYAQVFGYPTLPNDLKDPETPVFMVPDTIADAIRAALRDNPLIDSSNKQVDLARVGTRTARTDFLPSVNLVGTANYEDDREGTIGDRRDWSVAVQATWNLFSGFATRAGVAQASHAYSASLYNHLFVNRQVEQEMRLAWQGVITACERRLLLQNAVTIAQEVYDSRIRLREAGQETAINVLDAESEVFSSQINLLGATYDEKLAIYRMWLGMGNSIVGAKSPYTTSEERAAAQERHDAKCLERMETVDAALRAPRDSQSGEEDKANPFDQPPADDDASTNPFNQPAAPEGTNPFDQPAEDESAETNPFNQPADDKDAETNPFNQPAADEQETENPFDKPAEDEEAEEATENPLNQPASQEQELETENPFDRPVDDEQTKFDRSPGSARQVAATAPQRPLDGQAALSQLLDEADDDVDVSETVSRAVRPKIEFQSDDGLSGTIERIPR